METLQASKANWLTLLLVVLDVFVILLIIGTLMWEQPMYAVFGDAIGTVVERAVISAGLYVAAPLGILVIIVGSAMLLKKRQRKPLPAKRNRPRFRRPGGLPANHQATVAAARLRLARAATPGCFSPWPAAASSPRGAGLAICCSCRRTGVGLRSYASPRPVGNRGAVCRSAAHHITGSADR